MTQCNHNNTLPRSFQYDEAILDGVTIQLCGKSIRAPLCFLKSLVTHDDCQIVAKPVWINGQRQWRHEGVFRTYRRAWIMFQVISHSDLQYSQSTIHEPVNLDVSGLE